MRVIIINKTIEKQRSFLANYFKIMFRKTSIIVGITINDYICDYKNI